MALNKSKIVGFPSEHIGASKTRSYEDRHYFGRLTTEGGLDVTLALVADGVGGGNLGQRAAELTKETVVREIRASTHPETELISMLGAAIGTANKAVYQESKSATGKSGMSSTLAIALVCNDRLYIANVGDSRIYLIRDGKATQITVDHTFANERVRQGILTPEKAFQHPNADSITRSIGFEANVVIDFGLYINGGQESGQKAYAHQGLLLTNSDVLLVCSDGLIKETRQDKFRHYVEENELSETVAKYHAEEAAKVLVDLAVGRNVDDNVTAVIMEFAGRKIKNVRRQRAIVWSGVSMLLLVILFAVIQRLRGVTGELDQLTQSNINGTNTAIAYTNIAASYTPTPTATLRPTLVPGEIGAVFINGNRQPFLVNMSVSVTSFTEVHVNHRGVDEDGLVYMLAQSKILFDVAPSDVMDFVVFPSSQLFVYPGQYAAGVGMRLAEAKGTVIFSVSGSCMDLNYQGEKVTVSCYEGNCSYQINYGGHILIPVGRQISLDVNTLLLDSDLAIPWSQANSWYKILPYGTHARECVSSFIPDFSSPTPKDRDTHSSPILTIAPTTVPVVTTSLPTDLPPTISAPTDPAPTEKIPNTHKPPTDPPPTDPPATEPPPTDPPVTDTPTGQD